VSTPVHDDRATRAAPWVASTYLAEGLPFSIVHQVATQLFTFHGASLEATGLTSLLGIPWNAKFAWSPIVDRVSTTRRWVVGVELVLAALIGFCALPAQSGELGVVVALLVPFAFFAATHDIAVDGFYLRALGKNDQAALSGFRVAAYRAALLLGNGFLVALAGWVSWRVAILGAAGILAVLALFHALFLPRPSRAEPAPGGIWVAYREAFSTFVKQPRGASVLAFLLTFRAGDALMFAMATPLLKDLGVDMATRGIVSGVIGTVASIVGAILGGLLIARVTLTRALFPIALAQCAAIPIYALMAWSRPSLPFIVVGVVVEQLVAGVGTAAFTVFILRRCFGTYKATHYAVATAIMSLAMTVSGSVSGYLAARVGFPVFFMVAFFAAFPGVILARRVPTT
jgi:PAT family beta-lactamase induction signal transducer AmpG